MCGQIPHTRLLQTRTGTAHYEPLWASAGSLGHWAAPQEQLINTKIPVPCGIVSTSEIFRKGRWFREAPRAIGSISPSFPRVAAIGHAPTLRSRVCKARLQTKAWGEVSWSPVEWVSQVDTAWRGRSLTDTGDLPGRIPSAPSSPGPRFRWPGRALLCHLRFPHPDCCLKARWPRSSASGHLRDPNNQHATVVTVRKGSSQGPRNHVPGPLRDGSGGAAEAP